jgi:hypothetical protein
VEKRAEQEGSAVLLDLLGQVQAVFGFRYSRTIINSSLSRTELNGQYTTRDMGANNIEECSSSFHIYLTP